MLVNILVTFTTENRTYRRGENLDVPREQAAKWVADGYAAYDTDGQVDAVARVSRSNQLLTGDQQVVGVDFDPDTSTINFPEDVQVKVPPVVSWGSGIAPGDYVGRIFVPDVGVSGSYWNSDGVNLGLVGGRVVLARGHTDLSVAENSTAEETLVSVPIPAGVMGANGCLEVITFWKMTNSANTKRPRIRLAGTEMFAPAQTVITIFLPPPTRIWNRNSAASQLVFAAANGNTTSGTGTAETTATINTAAAQTLTITGEKAVGTETLTLMAWRVELVRA